MFIILLILAEHLGNISSFILYNKFQKYITSLLLLRKLKSINAMLSKVVIPVNKEHKVDRYLPLFTFILFLFLCVSVYTHTCAPTSGGQGLTRLWVQMALLINNSSVQPFLTISDLYSIFNLLDPLCCFLGLQFLPLYLRFYELFFVLLGFFILQINTKFHHMTHSPAFPLWRFSSSTTKVTHSHVPNVGTFIHTTLFMWGIHLLKRSVTPALWTFQIIYEAKEISGKITLYKIKCFSYI